MLLGIILNRKEQISKFVLDWQSYTKKVIVYDVQINFDQNSWKQIISQFS